MKKRSLAILLCLALTICLFGCKTESGDTATNDQLFRSSVIDAMIADKDEIMPLVNLTAEDKRANINEDNEVLLLSWHSFPESYPAGEIIQNDWGVVWTFTDQEILSWFNYGNNKIASNWETRLEQLIGLPEDCNYTHFSAVWTDVANVIRPGYVTDVTKPMKNDFEGTPNSEYKQWFDQNILDSYFDGAFPWTRLGYTYDWADNGQEYGLSEFIIKQGSSCRVAFTKNLEQFVSWLVNGGDRQ